MNIRKSGLGLAIASVAMAMFGFSQAAKAADYVGNCAAVPASVTGNATIGTAGTACTIPAAGVSATGNMTVLGSTITTTGNLSAGGSFTLTGSSTINIKAVNSTGALTVGTTASTITTTTLTSGGQTNVQINGVGNVTTGAVSAGSNLKAVSSSGILFLNGTVTSNTGAGGGNILLQAGGNVRAGAISTSGAAKTGGVQIDANMSGGNTLFTIGSNATNGVTSINTSNSTGGGVANNFVVGGLQVTNGTAASTGGITVSSMPAINVGASASRSGIINLNAQNGTITLPSGTLNSNGAAGFGAGQIALLANTVTTANGTIISATQTSAAAATVHGAVIAANTINVAGANGLKILGDGNGSATAAAYAAVIPKGGVTLSSNNDFVNLLWTLSSFALNTNGAVTVAGASAPITLQANGDNAQVTVSGYPIAFNNGAVNLTSKGSFFGGHNIVVQYSGTFAGTNGLTFAGNGAVTFDTSGNTGTDSAGHISVLVDQASINATVPSVTFNANGVSTGNGGTINYQPTKIVALAAPAVNISANGPSGYINFNPRANATTWGDASITSTTFNLTANAPTTGTANAGTIFLGFNNSTFAANTKMKFSAVGPTTGSGNGGSITVFPGNVTGGTFKLGTNAGNLQVLANAGSTGGDGGSINVNPFPGSISIETANAVSAAASTGAAANSKGGNVTLIGNPNVTVVPTVVGASINVDGKGTSDGGTIKIWGNGTLALGNSAGSLALSATAAGTGNGGTIEVGYVTNLTTSDTISVAGGIGANSNGKGGTINIHDAGSIVVGTTTFDASGQGDGKGGNITLNNTFFNSPIDITQANFNAKAGATGTGLGGQVVITQANAPNSIIDVNVRIKTDGGSGVTVTTDSFGQISLNGINCQQWKTGFQNAGNAFPATYWNCIDGARATGVPTAIAANTLEAGLRNLLGLTKDPNHQSVQIYVMPQINSYQAFFGRPVVNSVGAYGISNPPTRISVSFASVYNQAGGLVTAASYSGSPTIMQGAMVHELAHQLDYIWGNISSIVNGAFENLRLPDYAFLDVDPNTNATRPCNTVFDATSPYCADETSSGRTNSQELVFQYPDLSDGSPVRDSEYFAKVFEHIKSVQPGSGYSVDPWLEAPLRFLPGMTGFIQNLINNPPGPTN